MARNLTLHLEQRASPPREPIRERSPPRDELGAGEREELTRRIDHLFLQVGSINIFICHVLGFR